MKTKFSTVLASALLVASTATAFAATADPSKNKAIAREWFEEVIIKENSATADKLLDKDVVVEFAPGFAHSASGMLKQKGSVEAKKHLTEMWKKYDFTGAITEVIAEGDKVALLRTVTEKTADGKTATFPWVTIFTIKDGKITGMKHVHDTMSEHTQLEKAVASKAPVAKAPAAKK